MNRDRLKNLLERLKSDQISLDSALETLANLPFEDIDFARIDHHRALRRGHPEVVFCEGKTATQVVAIVERLARQNTVLATRATEKIFEEVKRISAAADYNSSARTIVVPHPESSSGVEKAGTVLVISAGTADIPVAEEAVVTATTMGNRVERLYDVGVAGIHRLFAHGDQLKAANVLIVVAGMDGVLPAVVSGVTERPVIAVPTSIGYGASFNGVGPLLTMLNACSPGIAVVNIDNGFGAGYFASLINS